MPCRLTWEPKGVVRQCTGITTGSEIAASVREVEADARFDDLRFVINDLTDCAGLSIAPEDVAYFAAMDTAAAYSNERIRIAMVGTLPDMANLVAGYARLLRGVYRVRRFETLREARDWLATS